MREFDLIINSITWKWDKRSRATERNNSIWTQFLTRFILVINNHYKTLKCWISLRIVWVWFDHKSDPPFKLCLDISRRPKDLLKYFPPEDPSILSVELRYKLFIARLHLFLFAVVAFFGGWGFFLWSFNNTNARNKDHFVYFFILTYLL